MSEVINPPEYYFTGIDFNPAFYAEDAGGALSQAVANTLYLRKTVPEERFGHTQCLVNVVF